MCIAVDESERNLLGVIYNCWHSSNRTNLFQIPHSPWKCTRKMSFFHGIFMAKIVW